jgi:hypothetical protein
MVDNLIGPRQIPTKFISTHLAIIALLEKSSNLCDPIFSEFYFLIKILVAFSVAHDFYIHVAKTRRKLL